MSNPAASTLSLDRELLEIGTRIRDYLLSSRYLARFRPAHLEHAVYAYLRAGGKALRPAMLLWSCALAGGDQHVALPAAAALEVYHTWTLVHDDIIDRDDRRRGSPTVHEDLRGKGVSELGLSPLAAEHYGRSIAVLAGDSQHAWGISLFTEAHRERGADASLILSLIEELENEVLNAIAEGETLDLQLSCRPIEEISEEQIIHMLAQKTAALYRFAARAGAMIGLNRYQPEHPLVETLARFAYGCGIAFQVQDDILGLLGADEELGKPVGSDLREGKRTVILHHAWAQADAQARALLKQVVGNSAASEQELAKATRLLDQLGGIARARELAQRHLDDSLASLAALPSSPERDRLAQLAQRMVDRRK